MKEKYTRLNFLKRVVKNLIGGSAALFLGGIFISGCQSDSESSSNEDSLNVESCADLSKVSDEELKKREGFGYVEKTPMPDKKCQNCNLYFPPKEGQICGGCILFEGPVFEEGYCTYWAPGET